MTCASWPSRGRDGLEGHSSAPPPPACWGRAAAARDGCYVLIYKKGHPLNSLKSLEPKRQVLSADRQDRSGDRQKPLALLSVLCQGRDSQPTTWEGQNDGRSTEPAAVGEQPDYHQAGLSRLSHKPQRSEYVGAADPHAAYQRPRRQRRGHRGQ